MNQGGTQSSRGGYKMKSDEFEGAFSIFLERYEYDDVQNALFTITRKAFEAGWLAAGGNPLQPQELYKLVRGSVRAENTDRTQDSPTE